MRSDIGGIKLETTLKFILKQLKMLSIDEYGEMHFVDNVDNVIYDLYDYKNLVRKLYNCENNRQHIAVFSDFGMDELFDLVNDERLYYALEELIAINVRTEVLEKLFKRATKKGKKKDKDLVKEYEFIKELYTDSIKRLRKELKIEPRKKRYKKKYSTLASLTKNKSRGFGFDDDYDYFYDDDVYSMSRALNSVYDKKWYDDDDDDDYNDGLYDKFMKTHYGDKGKKSKKNMKDSYQSINSYDDEDDDELSSVEELKEQIQHLIALQSNNGKASVDLDSEDYDFDISEDIQKEIAPIKKSVKTLEKGIVELSNTVHQVMEFLYKVTQEKEDENDDDDDEDGPMVSYPQQGEESYTQYDKLTKEELVSIINSGDNEPVIKTQTQTTTESTRRPVKANIVEETVEPILNPQVITYPREGKAREEENKPQEVDGGLKLPTPEVPDFSNNGKP